MANMTFKTNLLPNSDLGYNLGSTTAQWNIYGNLIGTANYALQSNTADNAMHSSSATYAASAKSLDLYEARGITTTLNKEANYVGAGKMFHLIASSSTTTASNGKPPMGDANILQMNWDNSGGYDAQLAISTAANRMEFRDQISTSKAWREVVTSTPGTAAGSNTRPIYISTAGVATICDATLGVSISGNAATATKLGTSTVGNNLNGIYLNGGAPTTLATHYYHYDVTEDWSSYSWHKVCEITVTSAYADYWIKFLISAGDNADIHGILTVRIRTSADVAYETMQVRWANRSTSIPLSDFVGVYTQNGTTSVKAELWCHMRGRWAGYSFRVLDGGARAGGGTNYWGMMASTSGHGTANRTAGTGAVTSSDTPTYGAAWN